MRKVEQIMGLPISVDIPGCSDETVFYKVFEKLNKIDRQFSTYKKESDLSKYQRGEIKEEDLSTEFRQIMHACKEASKLTGGYFSAYFSDKFDPTGYVKGWAIARAAEIIESSGCQTYCIGAGGDILAGSNSGKIWNIGIQDPKNKKEIIGKISAKNLAAATSGNYERGNHIVNPKTGEAADELLSVTVVGPEIITADIFATAIFTEGASGLILAEETEGYEAMAIAKNGDIFMSSNMFSAIELV
jgi:thiamine biosynthesis lipoprotein